MQRENGLRLLDFHICHQMMGISPIDSFGSFHYLNLGLANSGDHLVRLKWRAVAACMLHIFNCIISSTIIY